MSYCKIRLGEIGTLSPGDSVFGTILCVFKSAQKFREIKCTLEGKETTRFSKKQGKRRRWYSGNHCLFKMKTALQDEGTIPPGSYEYPFNFTLPSITPSSYQDANGNIRYFITATVDIPFALDYTDELTVHVSSPINFNHIRQQLQMEPVIYQDEKSLCCWCCASSPIRLTVVLKKNAFIVGEVIKLKIDVDNLSGQNIEQLQIKLIRHVDYRCDNSSKTHHEKFPIAYTNASGVGAHGQRAYLLAFEIPATLMVGNFALCSLIKDYWVLQVEAVIAGCHTNLSVYARVILGHIPLENHRPNTLTPTAPTASEEIKSDRLDALPSYYDATHVENSASPSPSAPPKKNDEK